MNEQTLKVYHEVIHRITNEIDRTLDNTHGRQKSDNERINEMRYALLRTRGYLRSLKQAFNLETSEKQCRYDIAVERHNGYMNHYDGCTKRDGKPIVSIENGVIVLRFTDANGIRYKIVNPNGLVTVQSGDHDMPEEE